MEHGLALPGSQWAWLGDGNNVCASFVHAAEKLGFKLRIATPAAYAPRSQEIAAAKAAGADVTVTTDARAAVEGADVIVTDTWVSMGADGSVNRHNLLAPFRVDEDLMARTDDAWFLHCLPARRGEEVTHAVMESSRSAVWRQAENRMHTARGALAWLTGVR